MKKLLSFITSAAVLGITMMGRPVFAASSPPNWIHDTPAQLVAQFGDHHPLTLQLSGMIGVSAQVVQQLPNAKAVAGALANPSITAQQRAALESIPTEIKLVNSRGISGGDPVDDAQMMGYNGIGNWIWTFEVNEGFNSSGGIITSISFPNYYGTTEAWDWVQTGSPSTTFITTTGGSDFLTENFDQFTSDYEAVDNVQLNIAYHANGTFDDTGYVNGAETWMQTNGQPQ